MELKVAKLDEDRRGEQGAWLFLISLAVFFIACMVLYAIYVLLRIAPEAGEVPPFYLPPSFLLTTVNLVAVSILLHMAVGAIRREKRTDFARYLILSAVLAVAFIALQSVGMVWLVGELGKPGQYMQGLYGLTFFLVVIHALHVVGGAAGIVFLLFGLSRDAYDHERYFPIRFCALYWHFLDVVWIIMLACFGLAAYVSKMPT